MTPLIFAISFSLLNAHSEAAQNWEVCMDKADFSFTHEDFLQGSKTVSKDGCEMRLLVYGGKGEKFEVNLCDPVIHIKRYDAIDSAMNTKLVAGEAGCPAPMFGANFDENARELQEFRAGRARVFAIFDLVKNFYAPNADRVNINEKSFSEKDSSGKIACGQYLLKEYLQKCMVFEAKKIEDGKGGTKDTTPSNILGVHPQTILIPTKK